MLLVPHFTVIFFLFLSHAVYASADISEQHPPVQVALEKTEIDLLDELEQKTEDIINRSHTTPEDISKQAQIPTWKKWAMQAGDLMYWTYQTGVDAVQSLCTKCKNAITGSDDTAKKSA